MSRFAATDVAYLVGLDIPSHEFAASCCDCPRIDAEQLSNSGVVAVADSGGPEPAERRRWRSASRL